MVLVFVAICILSEITCRVIASIPLIIGTEGSSDDRSALESILYEMYE